MPKYLIAKKILLANKAALKKKFLVSRIGIFGSYVRNEQSKNSDLDILVDFNEPISLFHFIRLKNELSKLLKVKVDLVMKDSLKPNIGKYILKEVSYV